MATNDEKPTTAVEAAVAPETTDTSAAAETTGTTSIVDDIAQAASAVTSAAPTPGTATGTATPCELDEHQRRNSLNVTLADMCAKGTALYAQKKYEDAAEMFSRATEMQAEMNGDMNPENAEIWFLYGRAVFEVGKSKSDVLGNAPAAGNEGAKKAKAKKSDGAKAATEGAQPEKIIEKAITGASGEATQTKTDDAAKNPLLQFEGDEDYDDSDEEMEDEEADGEEEDDDFAIAFYALDLARVLYTKKLESEQQRPDTEEEKGQEASAGDSPAVKHIKERLADTHDLLAEISLEGEKYTDAIKDLRSSLGYRQALLSEDNGSIAECHFKLSIALGFASATHSQEDDSPETKKVSQDLREEAVKEMQAAIDSTKAKLQAQEVELATMHSPDDNDKTKDKISDARELIADMEQRLVELEGPPVSLKADIEEMAKNALGGLFGAGGSAEEIEEAKKKATDLSGLVRKKAKEEPKAADVAVDSKTNGQETSSKRKAEEPLEADTATESKKAKIDARAL